MSFKQPPVLHNAQGKLRTIGFELEYANLSIEESVQLVQELFGGTVQKENRFKQKVTGTSLGDFTIEFDLTLLSEKRYKKIFDALNIQLDEIKVGDKTLEYEIESALEGIIGKIFPNEIACPPVPCTELNQLEKLREALYHHHAKGTQSFPTNAFGTHINVEAPDLEPATLLRYLRAFILLYPWLVEVGKTDLARKLSPFIDPYPDPYVQAVLAPDYNPDLDTFIKDYNAFNPDRNRPLDLYPILASLKKDLVTEYQGLGKVNARCTFHYRLPNSSIAEPGWTLAQEWNNWVAVEELVNDPQRIASWSNEYLVMKANTLLGFDNKWASKINEWVSSNT
jgi:hypothetical protein